VKVRFTAGAIRQIAEISEWIALDDPATAASVLDEVVRITGLAARHPGIGRSTQVPGLRVVPIKPYPYLIFYRPAKAGGIEVIRVRSMARKSDWRTGR